ncbi:hypothetical protein J7L05_03725 [bacterium]|nr:hypothetical protein [bacterium]
MHYLIRAVSGILLLLLLIGCSGIGQPAAPDVGGGLPDQYEGGDEEGIFRYLAAVEDRHASFLVWQGAYQNEGNSALESKLVDCIAATCWEVPDGDEDYFNYILVCDSKRRWDNPSSNTHTTIIRIGPHFRPLIPSKTEYDISSSYFIENPDACTLAVHNDFLWVFVYDADDHEISGWRWAISTNPLTLGHLVNPVRLPNFQEFDCDDGALDYVSGMAWVPLDEDGDEWHLICCDPVANQIVVIDDNGSVDTTDDNNYGNDHPIDACVVWIDDNEWDKWIVYIAVQESSNRNQDYLYSYYHNSVGYGSPVQVTCNTGGNYFPFVLGLDVRAFDDLDQDDDQCIAVLMRDIDDMDGYRIRQGYCGRTSGTMDDWISELDTDSFENPSSYPNSTINHGESFAMCKMSKGTDTSNCWEWGNYYIIGDRDPILVDDDEEDSGENALDGNNVKIFKNFDTIICQ